MQELISFLKLLVSSNTVNFILMLIILAYIVKKIDLNNIFEGSVNLVKASIDKSDEEKNKSQSMLKEAQNLMEKLPEDVKELESNAKTKVEIFKDKIEEDTQKTIYNLEKNVDRVISIEEKKISNILTDKTSKASVELAKLQIAKLLGENPDLHNQFIQNSLDELDKVVL